jgi:hypothetical protein
VRVTVPCCPYDGLLGASVWNRKSGKLVAMSDQMDDEFLSIQIMKNGRKGVLPHLARGRRKGA